MGASLFLIYKPQQIRVLWDEIMRLKSMKMPRLGKVFLYCAFLLIGCLASLLSISIGRGTRGEVVKVNSINELIEMVKRDEEYTIQLTLEGCIYCEALDFAEHDYLLNHNITLYEYEVPAERREEERDFLENIFGEPLSFPSIYRTKDGRVFQKLEMGSDTAGFESAMDRWIADGVVSLT